MLTQPLGRPHSTLLVNVCPKCAEKKLRTILSATPEQTRAGVMSCPVHGVMTSAEIKQHDRSRVA
jgi:hypothetical protein